MANDGEIEVTFATNAGMVASDIDRATKSTEKAEDAAQRFTKVQVAHSAASHGVVMGLRGVADAAQLAGSRMGLPTRHVAGLLHVMESLGAGLSTGGPIVAGIVAIGIAIEQLGAAAGRAQERFKALAEASKKFEESKQQQGQNATDLAQKLAPDLTSISQRLPLHGPYSIESSLKEFGPILGPQTVLDTMAHGQGQAQLEQLSSEQGRLPMPIQKALHRQNEVDTTEVLNLLSGKFDELISHTKDRSVTRAQREAQADMASARLKSAPTGSLLNFKLGF